MKAFWSMAAIAAAAASLTACGRKPKSPPVAAAPVIVAAAEPLSVPQTSIALPPEQPIPPDAIPPEREPEPVVENPPVLAPEPPASPAKPAAGTAAPPRQASQPPPKPAPSPPQIRPQLRPGDELEMRRQINRAIGEAQKLLSATRIGKEQEASAERIRAFIEQAEEARRQGDLVRAKSLAERAELLASDLARSSR